MKKTFKIVSLFLIIIFVLCSCGANNGGKSEIIDENTFKDDLGVEFTVEKPYEKIISLYSAHTENLYAMGAEDKLIGAHKTSIYPPAAAFLPRYDYKTDPEALIAAEPDLVIIRPFINRNYPEYIKAIEKAGIKVVSLYPEKTEDFEKYIKILGMIVGKEDEANKQLALLNKRLDEIKNKVKDIKEDDKEKVFFESTKTDYRTVTKSSNPGRAIEMAGGINIAGDPEPIENGSSIAEFGIENIMLNADNIDVYVSQRGAMNSGGSIIEIPQREGFKAVKAVKEGRILELNEKIISSPTFRYYKGVNEIARMLYPDLMDDYSNISSDDYITRENYAVLTVKLNHSPIFIPSSSHYYESKYYNHNYGLFDDVKWTDKNFDFIETAAMHTFIQEIQNKDGKEHFDKNGLVTREDLALTIYIMEEIQSSNNNKKINDIAKCENGKIVQKVVDKGLMKLDDNGNFNPKKYITEKEAKETLEKAIEAGEINE